MLDPDTLYIIFGDEDDAFPAAYGRTPDGIGMYWYDADQHEEAKGDVGPVLRTRSFNSHREFDNFRDGLS